MRHFQKIQGGVHDLWHKSQLHMRRTTQQPVVSTRQRGGGTWENNIVAVGIPAGEQGMPVRVHACVKRLMPVPGQPHLPAIGEATEARQPGTAMRRSERDHMRNARFSLPGLQPGACRQAPHAVTDQQRRQTGRCGNALHSVLNGRRIVVDRRKGGLQINRHKCMARALKQSQPGRPKAAIAEKPMDKHHAAPARYHTVGRDLIGDGT